jgi:paraquat-inducible protein A
MRWSTFRRWLWVIRGCLVVSAVLLGAGLAGPCMSIEPAFGAMDGWVRLLKPDLAKPTHYSVVGGIVKLIQNGSTAVGLLLLGFSVIFPTVKLAVMAAASVALAGGERPGALMKLAHHAGKFSMLDVFVVGLIVLAIKGLPGGSRVTLEWGVTLFAASVVLSLVASLGVSMLERRTEARPTRAGDPAPASGASQQSAGKIFSEREGNPVSGKDIQ